MGVGAGIFLWLVANISFAASYVTSWDRAQWTLMPSELACKLTHSIDGFGEARLSREAGGVDQLVIVSRNGLLNRADYQVTGRAPAWQQEAQVVQIARVSAQQELRVSGAVLRDVIGQLEANFFVNFSKINPNETQIAPRYFSIALTPRNFKKAYGDYLACVNSMIPFSFAQVSKLTYQYAKDATDLSHSIKQHLDKMLRYSRADERVLGIIIDAHSHADLTEELSFGQAQLQADLVADYLEAKGYAQEKIMSRVHGDRFPVANNSEVQGQAKNRRVTVRLEDEQLRQQRKQRIQARQKQHELEKERLAQQEIAVAAAAKKREEEQVLYIKNAKEAMKSKQPVETIQVIRKSKPGISIEELRSLVEGQDLSHPRQPKMEIRME